MTATDDTPHKAPRRRLTLPKKVPAGDSGHTGAHLPSELTGAPAVGDRLKVELSGIDEPKARNGHTPRPDPPAHREETQRRAQSLVNDAAPSMPLAQLPLQDRFLTVLCQERIPVTIFLMSGGCAKGVLQSFDAFTLLLEGHGSPLVYKHLISTIVPARAMRTPIKPSRAAAAST